MSPWTLTARWVFPVAGPPLEGGVVTIASQQIVAVWPRGSRGADVDLGNAALLPGFVNAHTHLDLSALRGKVPPGREFTDWLRAVIRHRRMATPAETVSAVREGLDECLRCGTTLVGDTSGQGLSWPILAEGPVRASVFLEVLGLTQERAAAASALARDWLTEHLATTTCRPALSPHASYSVRASLFEELNKLAREFHVPLMTHLAETREELTLLSTHGGPFVGFLKELGVWDESGLAGDPTSIWQASSAGGVRTVLAHGNYLDPSAAIPPHVSVVYCPRTHAAFGHGAHPFRDLIARGVRVALGTDGLSSNPDLDILAEARFLRALYPDFPGAALLRMLTLSGAEALGWGAETGSVAPGKSADLVVLPLPDQDCPDPHDLVFSSLLPVSRVLCRGRWLDFTQSHRD